MSQFLEKSIQSDQDKIKSLIMVLKDSRSKRIILGMKNLKDSGLKLFLQQEWKDLEELHLHCNSISPDGALSLGQGSFPNLRILNLDNNMIGNLGLRYLKRGEWKKLSTLTMKSNNLGNTGLEELSKIQMPKLRTLFIGSNKITSEGILFFNKSNLPHLRYLKIKDNSLGWWGCINLCNGNWKIFSKLYLCRQMLKKVGMEQSQTFAMFQQRLYLTPGIFRCYENVVYKVIKPRSLQIQSIWFIIGKILLIDYLIIQKRNLIIYLFQTKRERLVMYTIDSLTTAFMKPIFSPRSEMSKYLNDIEKNKTNLVINIDKETLGLYKNEFEYYDNKLDQVTFVATGLKIMKSWQKDLQYRQSRMVAYLLSLFEEIENKIDGIYVSWDLFNNLIIQKALNLKSLQTSQADHRSQLKHVNWSKGKAKLPSPVKKIVSMNRMKKIAYLCQQTNKIQFLNSIGNQNQNHYKPLVLDRQDLLVEKTLVKRVKNQGSKLIGKQNYKKDVVVSGYSITFLDMIYIQSDRYEMLLTSSSDGIVRGWDVQGTIPTLSKQPENEEERMIHQFPVQIYSMVWDEINDVLYCTSKDEKIYIWMVKTDSEKQLFVEDGHKSMISSLIVMPKLQFLATGDYEGKLILWDTISLSIKYKYQEHVRSIVSMAFHEALILLFTASYDHSICVWNPYIPSLIYKIACNLNVIELQIIQGTNYLAALDVGSNLKIRQINKFNLISTFVVDRPEQIEGNKLVQDQFIKIQPTCLTISHQPTRFFFGGHSIKCMQFDDNQGLAALDTFPSFIKYHPQKMKLYVVIKTNILIWDMLTGQLDYTLQSQADQQITAIELVQNSQRFVVGDINGTIFLRKLQNGIKIAKVYKHKNKVAVNHLITKIGGTWNESMIIGCFQDSQIVVFGKDHSQGYSLLRNFNLRKSISNSFVTAISYQVKRNILLLATSGGEIVFYDVDKNKITNQIQVKGLETIYFSIRAQVPSFLSFGKNGEVFGVYLPPHSKKFKTSTNLVLQGQGSDQKIVAVQMSSVSNVAFFGFENGFICKILLSQHFIKSENSSIKQVKKIQPEWEVKFNELPKDMILIMEEQILAVILYSKNISLISSLTGQVLNVLPNFSAKANINFFENPLFYYTNSQGSEKAKQKIKQRLDIEGVIGDRQDEEKKAHKKHRIFLGEKKKFLNFEISAQAQGRDEIFHNPDFLPQQYLKVISKQKAKEQKNSALAESKKAELLSASTLVWNHEWKVRPSFQGLVAKNLEIIDKVWRLAKDRLEKPIKKIYRNNSTSKIERAVEAKKRWQQAKQEQEEEQNKEKSKLLTLSSFKYPNTQQVRNDSMSKKQEKKGMTKHKSLYKNESSPFVRLGLALQKINDQDPKAIRYIEMGQKKQMESLKGLKLPKINQK